MKPADAVSLLRRADSLADLPRLGGMARPDGVVIVSERHWAFARVDGSVQEGGMPSHGRLVGRLPLVRGLERLVFALAPLMRGKGVAGRKERLVLLAALVAPLSLALLSPRLQLAGGILIAVALVAWLFRGRTLRLHGAEHRAIAAAEERRLGATWQGLARPSRFAARCGTNFAAIAIVVTVAFQQLWPFPPAVYSPAVITPLALALSMELWQAIHASGGRSLRVLLLPGLALQRLTTREPAVADSRLALVAVASVLRRELDL